MIDIKFIHGDCLEEMPKLADKSIDMILCDLPYGTTACKWDTIIPFEPLWEQYKRLIKDNGAIVLFGQEPFSSLLRNSNLSDYKYDWYWQKERITNVFQVKRRPGKVIEPISVFYTSQPIYHYEKTKHYGKLVKNKPAGNHTKTSALNELKVTPYDDDGTRYPIQLLNFNRDLDKLHETQKPVALFEYLIRTYTNEGDTVLDNCAGSGTTGIAALHTKRNAILIEKDEQYFNAAKERFDRETRQVAMW
jgi:site-specific DNA-methyltransferase (adenine-specific)